MPRASGVSNPPAAASSAAAAASSGNVGRSAGHSGLSCSAPAKQLFRPVTRSMTRVSDPIVASPGFKAGGPASTSTRRSTSDASFSTQLAASRPTATHARTPLKVTSSGWKPLTQPVALNEERQCAGLTINPTAKRSRFASSRAVKDSINHSASKANSNVPSGKKHRDEDIVSLGDQSDGAAMPSPTKKLQIRKDLSDAPSIRKSTIRILGVKGAAIPPTGKSSFATNAPASALPPTGKSSFANNAPAAALPPTGKSTFANNAPAAALPPTGKSSFANNAPAAALPPTGKSSIANNAPAAALPPTGKSSIANNAPAAALPPTVKSSVANNAASKNEISDNAAVPSLAQQLQPTLPRHILQNDYNKKPSNVPIMANQASGLAGATPPLITPKLEIGNMKDSSNPLSNPAYTRELLIKQQEQLLQQYKLGSSQQLYIKGPALFENDDPPPVEPLGTRCQLCKLDIAFRPQGDPGRDANAPPVIAVLACRHVFHSRCIESVYGLAEPAECLACLEPGAVH